MARDQYSYRVRKMPVKGGADPVFSHLLVIASRDSGVAISYFLRIR